MQDESMRTEMLETHKLPVKRLSAEGGFPEKAVEKYRQYIIALAIITRGSYPYVFSFIPQFFEEGA
jgi:RNA polymerase sigma factor